MELTDEQRQRIAQNRQAALERKRKRQEEEEQTKKQSKEEENNDELEDFEIDASPYVSLSQVKSVYCLPQGTIDVLEVAQTKPNPRSKSFAPLKLYHRHEVRKRAHKRWNGVQGLQQERQARANKKLKQDLKVTKNLFEK